MVEDRHQRLFLSPPHMSSRDRELLLEAFDSNWIAPLGPQVDAFEQEFADQVGAPGALALASGTAALHLALIEAGVGSGDEVLVSDLTFVASVNPVRYLGANPVLIGSERLSWNMDPEHLEDALRRRKLAGRRPAAVVAVHLYGQCADLEAISLLCEQYGVPLIEDAAEALGASYALSSGETIHPGVVGDFGIFSFNGNKIITTSGGGMLVAQDESALEHARKLSSQARDQAPHYEHSELGYNYRMSNLLAAVGRGQLQVLDERVDARRGNFEAYARLLGNLPGLTFQPEAPWGRHTRWLNCLLVEKDEFGAGPEKIRLALEAENIEARPLWKPMHLQPLYRDCEVYGTEVAEDLFARGLCLPSGSAMTEADLERVAGVIRGLCQA